MALLFERPMHPYEMVSLMRERGKHESVRLRYSSLYSVVGALEREGMISTRKTVREGRRPERTVYGITDAGRDEFLAWLRDLLSKPVKEYTQFAAELTFIAALSPEKAAGLLEGRVRLLEDEVEKMRSRLDEAAERLGLARLFLTEFEHELVLREAELGWVRDLLGEIRAGTLGGCANSDPSTRGPRPRAPRRRWRRAHKVRDERPPEGCCLALVHATGGTIMRGKARPSRGRDSIQTLVAVRRGGGWRFAAFHNGRVRPMSGGFAAVIFWVLTDGLWKALGPKGGNT